MGGDKGLRTLQHHVSDLNLLSGTMLHMRQEQNKTTPCFLFTFFGLLCEKLLYQYVLWQTGRCNVFIFIECCRLSFSCAQRASCRKQYMKKFTLIFVCIHDLFLFCQYPMISGIHQCFLIFVRLCVPLLARHLQHHKCFAFAGFLISRQYWCSGKNTFTLFKSTLQSF